MPGFNLLLSGCTAKNTTKPSEIKSTEVSSKSSVISTEKRKVIIDTDTAGDDAVALIMAAKNENVDILGVTVAAGNVNLDQAAKNALMTLEVAGCDAPVYKGA